MDQLEQPSRPRRISWPLAFVLIVLILALLAGWTTWKMLNWPVETAGKAAEGTKGIIREIKDAFVEVLRFQPRVVVRDRVFFEQSSDIAELATVTRVFQVERDSSHSWLGSTKKIRLRGIFETKAGYDLNDPFIVYVDEFPAKKIRIKLPPAKILSLDQKEIEVLRSEDGFWNKVQPGDVAGETNALNDAAREKAAAAQILAEAEKALLEQLRTRFGDAYEIEVIQPPKPLQ